MPNVRSLTIGVNWNIRSKTLEKANAMTDKAIGKAQKLGNAMRSGAKWASQHKYQLLGATTALAGGLGLAVKASADFQSQMRRVGSLAEANDSQLERLRGTAMQLGIDTAYSASEAAEGMQMLVRRGFNVNETIAAMPGLLSGAAANQVELAQSSQVVSTTLNTMGLEAQEATRVVDVLTKTANTSGADFLSLGEAFSETQGIMQDVGWSVEQVSTALGVLGDSSITGGRAGTILRNMVADLSKEAENGAIQLNGMAVRVQDAQGNFLSLNEIVGNMQGALEGVNDISGALNRAGIGRRAVGGLTTLLQESNEELNAYEQNLRNSAGYAGTVATEQLDTLSGATRQLKGTINALLITVGDNLLPTVRVVIDSVRRLGNWFVQLPQPIQTTIAVVGAAGAALLGLLTIVGFLYNPISSAISLMGVFNISLLGIVSPIAAVVAAGTALYLIFDDIRTGIQGGQSVIWPFIQSVYGLGQALWKGTINALQVANEWINEHANALKWTAGIFGTIFAPAIAMATYNLFTFALSAISQGITSLSLFAIQLLTTSSSAIPAFIGGIWSAAGGILSFAGNAIVAGISGIAGLATSFWSVITSIWAFNAALWANPVTWIIAGVMALGGALYLLYRNWDKVSQFLIDAWERVKGVWSAGVEWFKNTIDKWIPDWMQNLFTNDTNVTANNNQTNVTETTRAGSGGIIGSVTKLKPSDTKGGNSQQINNNPNIEVKVEGNADEGIAQKVGEEVETRVRATLVDVLNENEAAHKRKED